MKLAALITAVVIITVSALVLFSTSPNISDYNGVSRNYKNTSQWQYKANNEEKDTKTGPETDIEESGIFVDLDRSPQPNVDLVRIDNTNYTANEKHENLAWKPNVEAESIAPSSAVYPVKNNSNLFISNGEGFDYNGAANVNDGNFISPVAAVQSINGVSGVGNNQEAAQEIASTGIASIDPAQDTVSGFDLASTPEYKFISEFSDILNNGALDLTSDEITQLTDLYFEGKSGMAPEPVVIDGIAWSYTPDIAQDHTGIPDAWYDGVYHFQMGSGLEGESPHVNPEPSTMIMGALGILPALFGYLKRKYFR